MFTATPGSGAPRHPFPADAMPLVRRNVRWVLCCISAIFLWQPTSVTVAADPAPVSDADPVIQPPPDSSGPAKNALVNRLQPFLKKYCTDCHSASEPSADIVLDNLSQTSDLQRERRKWERVHRMVNAGAMPPPKHDPFPNEQELIEISSLLYDQLFNFDCSAIDHPGRPTVHRLNRAEYQNTIRDLFGVHVPVTDQFPQDDVGEGFDNNSDVLSLPPLLMEKYLDAAEFIAESVIDTRDFSRPLTARRSGPSLKSSFGTSAEEGGFVMLASTGFVSAEMEASGAGKYVIRVEAQADQAGDEKARIALRIDGDTVAEFELSGRRRPQWVKWEGTLSAGKHQIAAAFLNDYYNPEAADGRKDRNVMIRALELTGPEGGTEPAWHDLHRKFVTVRPDGRRRSVPEAAAAVLKPILYRAFRRPVADAEVNRFASLVDRQMTVHGETYDQGLSVALQAVLVSPDFLFRIERDPEAGQSWRTLSEYEVASRLSYFLWSSMPDEELLRLAEHQELLKPEVLSQQVRRMLQHPHAAALGSNFAAQWLNLRNLNDIRPNPEVFPDFDDTLRQAMLQETRQFFNTIVAEDLSIDEFFSARFTFVNARLAKHYGISAPEGTQFSDEEWTRVSLDGTNRSGVLTQASILTLTSNPGRTSPVKRGKWILENILGQSPPPAPPAVPALEVTSAARPNLSLREQLALHREDPGCASCHKTMDPLGLGLENFDAIGRWRDRDGDKPVDASGTLPSGESFSGPLELMNVFQQRREQFHRALVERMMVYALGRGLDYYDQCAVKEIVNRMKQHDYRFSSLVEGLVASDAFLRRSAVRDPALP